MEAQSRCRRSDRPRAEADRLSACLAQVEVLHENSEPVAGYSRANAPAYAGDDLRHAVLWYSEQSARGSQSDLARVTGYNLQPLLGSVVRLRFFMAKASTKLYSFRLE